MPGHKVRLPLIERRARLREWAALTREPVSMTIREGRLGCRSSGLFLASCYARSYELV